LATGLAVGNVSQQLILPLLVFRQSNTPLLCLVCEQSGQARDQQHNGKENNQFSLLVFGIKKHNINLSQ
jgi:hypothetical protein